MDKSPDAFRTISEVAEVLETPAHVLRFWESRFPQIRPVKRAGGRRYYRPADVALLTGIKRLLHDEGMTIRGVQKILREQGVRHVAGLSGQEVPDEAESAEAALEAALAANFGGETQAPMPQQEAESAQIVALEDALRARQTAQAAPDPVPEPLVADAVQAQKRAAPPAQRVKADADDNRMPELPFDSPAVEPPLTAASDHRADGARPEPDAPMPAAAPSDTAATDPDPLPLLARLRALPPGSLVHARPLRDRLAALADRMAAPPPHTPL